jgi:hypothetical protein
VNLKAAYRYRHHAIQGTLEELQEKYRVQKHTFMKNHYLLYRGEIPICITDSLTDLAHTIARDQWKPLEPLEVNTY